VNCARRDLCGGGRVTSIPTAIQRGTQTRLWARKGTRPRVVRQQQSESAYIFGVVCPQYDIALGLVLPPANTQTMALHPETISQAVPTGWHALLILDQAG
jgi:hypothetical protein